MTYIAKQVVKGKTYYVAQRSERINGKPRVVWRKRLGTVDDILRVFEGRHLDHIQFSTFDFGKAAAFFAIAEELDFINTVNQIVNKKPTPGLTPGEYLLLIILGRCHGPYSKQGTAKWFDESFLQFVWNFPHQLNSQNFLNHMAYLDEDTIENVVVAIGKKLVEMGVTTNALIWDTTNFSTNIEQWGDLPRKGKAKDKKSSQNLIGLGVATSSEGIPLYHHTYPGNEHDAPLLSQLINGMIDKLRSIKMNIEETVLVFDKGNNSEDNIKKILENIHVVGSLKRNQLKELLTIPLDSFNYIYTNRKKHRISGFRTKRKVFDKEFTILVTYNPATEKKQKLTYERNKVRILEAIDELAQKYKRQSGRGRKIGRKGLENTIHDLIPKDLRSTFDYTINEDQRTLQFWVDETKETELYSSFGKTTIFTDMHTWSDKKIAQTYHMKWRLEDDFKWFKGKLLIPIPPFYVRKDEMIRAHIFLCIMGMIFARYLKRRVKIQNISMKEILDRLEKLRVALIKDMSTGETALKLEQMDHIQAKIFSTFKLERYLKVK